ncbi:hypothetical protein PV767_18975 [Stenotrophomonas rhizophila]|uniref:hypothetical protein n=1 Tax=Stenotrophomonas TaxID=40323 RepID=UPI003B79CCCB
MSYTRAECETVLLKRHWSLHVKPRNRELTQKGERLDADVLASVRSWEDGATWSQVYQGIQEDVERGKQADPMTLAEAAGLFNMPSRQLMGIIKDGLLQEELLGGIPQRWSFSDVAALMGVSQDECEALKASAEPEPLLFTPSKGTVSLKEKARLERLEKAAQGTASIESGKTQAKAKPDKPKLKQGEAKRQLGIFKKAQSTLNDRLSKDQARRRGEGSKERVLPCDLISWADQHPILKDWRAFRGEADPVGRSIVVHGQPKTLKPSKIIGYIQVLEKGAIRVFFEGKSGPSKIIDIDLTNNQRIRKAMIKEGYAQVDPLGNVLKLESREQTLPEALSLDWLDNFRREQLLKDYTSALGFWGDELSRAANQAVAAIEGWKQEQQGDRVTAKRVALLDQKIQDALEEEKMAREWSNRARRASFEASLPRAAVTTKPAPFRF